MKLAQLYASKFVASKRGFVDSYYRPHMAIPLLSILQLACELRTGSFVAAENQKIFELAPALASPFLMHNFLEKFHKITGSFIVILPPRSIISFSPTTQLPYAIRKITRNRARVEPATAYLLMFVSCVCLGLGTAKIAIYRRVPGPAFLWFIAGTIFAFIALPLAIFSKPVRKSSNAKISLRADRGDTRSAQRREDEN